MRMRVGETVSFLSEVRRDGTKVKGRAKVREGWREGAEAVNRGVIRCPR